MRISVTEVISDTNIGGAGRLLLTRFALSDRAKFDQRIVLPNCSELEKPFMELGYDVQKMKYCSDCSFEPLEVISLYRYFKRTKPHIVNAHGCLSARIAAYLAKVPVNIYTRHCAYTPSRFMRSKLMRALNGFFANTTTDKIIAVADAAAQNLVDVGIDKDMIEIIINGVLPIEKYSQQKKIETKNSIGIPDNAFVCGICARLEDCKGIDVLLRAARRLVRKSEDYYFLIVGKGSCEIELKELSDALGLSGNVKFCGFTSDITPYINCFDVNLNCSRGTETSSLALSEGMSIGLPCIASDWGGNPYMVKHGYNGLIFPCDDFIALSDSIAMLHDDRVLYDEMAKKAYSRYCVEFNAEKMARKTEELYSELFLATLQNSTADAIVK